MGFREQTQLPDHYNDVSEGWWHILGELHAAWLISDPDYNILQVKEKFGTLRVYTNGLTKAGWDALRKAEAASAKTCESCGQPGSLDRRFFWMRTLCPACQGKRAEH
jgi:hypothetical protein